jgi:hypothetical protein
MCFVDEKEMKRVAGTSEDKELKKYLMILLNELCDRGWQVDFNEDAEEPDDLLRFFRVRETEYL